jgi:PAS domain S-box-containing protein
MPNQADLPVDIPMALDDAAPGGDPRGLAEALRRSQELLALAEQSAGIGIWDLDVATGLVRGTPTFFRILGLPPTAEPVPQSLPRSVRHPEDRARVEQGYRDMVERGGDTYETEYRIIHPDGQVRWIFGRGRTVRDAAGKPVRYSGVDIDITERKRAEEALRASEERFSKAFHSAAHPMSISTVADGRYIDVNAASSRASGVPREGMIGKTTAELGFYADPGQFAKVRELLARDGQFTDLETRLTGRNGTRTFLLSGALIELGGEACLLTSAIDITERKQAEEHVRLLMHEVNHRANNLLAVVQAIARQTALESDPESFVDRLSERISALAASNALLVSGKWQGADMAALVTSQLSLFAGLVGTRVVLDGPPVRLKPSAAQAIGMALHELATNAGKYGALANNTGRVRVEWRVSDGGAARMFHIAWHESGGPPVGAPSRTGFGHTVMVRMIEEAMNGKAMLEYAAQGVRWSLACPAVPALDLS